MDPFEYLNSLPALGIKMGFGRIKPILEEMGNPHRRVPSVIVAGTNGKGSTCAMAGSILTSLGLNVLVYTSPHLNRVNERISINRTPVSDEVLSRGIEEVRKAARRLRSRENPTYFECLTAAAFRIGSDLNVDAIVAEVGLGGRLDATNVLDPQVSGITSISMDHADFLGEDQVSIAGEKAGIIKPSVPVVIGPVCTGSPQMNRCLRTILSTAAENGSEAVIVCGKREANEKKEMLLRSGVPDWRIVEVDDIRQNGGTSADLEVEGGGRGDEIATDLSILDRVIEGRFRTPLIGRHQAWNMATALTLSVITYPVAVAKKKMLLGNKTEMNRIITGVEGEILKSHDPQELRKGISAGLERTNLRARFEVLKIEDKTIVLDGGHNEEAGWATSSTLMDIFPGKKVSLLISMMSDKNPMAYLSPMNEVLDSVYLTRLESERSMTVERLLSGVVKAVGDAGSIHIRPDLKSSFEEWFRGIDEDTIGLASGSFYMYGVVSDMLKKEKLSGDP